MLLRSHGLVVGTEGRVPVRQHTERYARAAPRQRNRCREDRFVPQQHLRRPADAKQIHRCRRPPGVPRVSATRLRERLRGLGRASLLGEGQVGQGGADGRHVLRAVRLRLHPPHIRRALARHRQQPARRSRCGEACEWRYVESPHGCAAPLLGLEQVAHQRYRRRTQLGRTPSVVAAERYRYHAGRLLGQQVREKRREDISHAPLSPAVPEVRQCLGCADGLQ